MGKGSWYRPVNQERYDRNYDKIVWPELEEVEKKKPEKKEFVNICYAENPRYSMALGVNPEQIEKAQKIHPNAEFNERGDMLIKNRSDKIRRMKERGFVEFE